MASSSCLWPAGGPQASTPCSPEYSCSSYCLVSWGCLCHSSHTALPSGLGSGPGTPGVVALLGAHSVGRTHCVKLVHRLYPEVDPQLNPDHVPHMLKKCPDPIPDPKAVQYVRNDRGTPMKLDNNYYKNILENKGLMLVDHQLATDKRKKPFVKKMAKNQDYFFKQFSKAITILSENNPLTGSKGEIRKQCNLANKLH
ncbi:unnamed protein product [Cuscuta epithymum]|uniref:peroxidase n=1 Tax=Cuscuta epithymum TaxID=186058 RepID=A0AAV0FDF9_9ASTE|nr:unnamed protein product [Cuscuta epithymum]